MANILDVSVYQEGIIGAVNFGFPVEQIHLRSTTYTIGATAVSTAIYYNGRVYYSTQSIGDLAAAAGLLVVTAYKQGVFGTIQIAFHPNMVSICESMLQINGTAMASVIKFGGQDFFVTSTVSELETAANALGGDSGGNTYTPTAVSFLSTPTGFSVTTAEQGTVSYSSAAVSLVVSDTTIELTVNNTVYVLSLSATITINGNPFSGTIEELQTALLTQVITVARSYKTFDAMLSQIFTNAPVAYPMNANDEDYAGTPVFTRLGVGQYKMTLAGAFATGKYILMSTSNSGTWYAYVNDDDSIIIETLDYQFQNADGIIGSGASIHVRCFIQF